MSYTANLGALEARGLLLALNIPPPTFGISKAGSAQTLKDSFASKGYCTGKFSKATLLTSKSDVTKLLKTTSRLPSWPITICDVMVQSGKQSRARQNSRACLQQEILGIQQSMSELENNCTHTQEYVCTSMVWTAQRFVEGLGCEPIDCHARYASCVPFISWPTRQRADRRDRQVQGHASCIGPRRSRPPQTPAVVRKDGRPAQ